MQEEQDECGLGEDDHAVFFRVEYEVTVDEDDNVNAQAATVDSHLHGVPAPIAAGTIMLAAVRMMSDHMAHTMFDVIGNHELAHELAHAAAKQYMIHAIKSLPEDHDGYSVSIPNDISELLKGE
jgi:muconolactone delta-isomerase